MKKIYPAALLVVLVIGYASVVRAGELIDYAGVNLNQVSINVDSFGATSVEDDGLGYKVFAGTRLSEHFYIEYGYQDLGEYTADYDITAGTFRFVESHNVNFTQSLFMALKARATVGQIFTLSESSTELPNIYLYVDLGGVFWRAELEMDGFLYDAGLPFGPYGASGDDLGLSGYYGFGVEYQVSKHFMLTLHRDIYIDVGKGVMLQHIDGSQTEYSGRDVESLGLSLSYLF